MSTLKLPFLYPDRRVEGHLDLGPDEREEFDELVYARTKFWESAETVKWFEAQGYILYRRFSPNLINHWQPVLPDFDARVEANFPYAHHDWFPNFRGYNRTATGTDTVGAPLLRPVSG
jgi:hypothetical protein